MIYVILSFIALLPAIAFCVSFIMYIQDRRRQRSVQDTARRHTLELLYFYHIAAFSPPYPNICSIYAEYMLNICLS